MSSYGSFLVFAVILGRGRLPGPDAPRVRRGLDAVTGTVLLGFSARLAAERA
jgi:hypothetical protein